MQRPSRVNENEALMTSMNLYEYSQVNNYEMGWYPVRKNQNFQFIEHRGEY